MILELWIKINDDIFGLKKQSILNATISKKELLANFGGHALVPKLNHTVFDHGNVGMCKPNSILPC